MRLFSKTDKNPKTPSSDRDKDHDPPAPSRSSARTKSSAASSTKSPEKSKSQNKNPKPDTGSPRSSRSRFPKPSSSRRTEDPDTHPLNLPLDQLQKRLSAMSAKSDATDVDAEGQSSMPGAFETPKKNEVNEAKEVNGTNGTHDESDADTEGPEPPPHKSNSSSPVQDAAPTPEQAEEFKAAGNKFYKAKEYKKAIEEYTKGIPPELPVRGQC
jgi:DnaJ family protein C protein 7